MQQTEQVIKERNLEKLSQNAMKMKELEFQMGEIEKKIEAIKLVSNKSRIDEKITKSEIEKLYQQTLKLYEEFNKKLNLRVDQKFVECFDEIAQRINESNIRRERLEDKKYDLTTLLKELEKISKDEEERDKKMDEDIDYLKSEYEFLKKNYDDVTKENVEINKQITEKNETVGKLEDKLADLKAVIGKLTEVRVMLNKYFSSHFENFTQGEKKIINDVKSFRITDEDKYKAAMNELLNSKQFGIGPMSSKNVIEVNQSIEISASNVLQQSQPQIQKQPAPSSIKEEKESSNKSQSKPSKPPTPNAQEDISQSGDVSEVSNITGNTGNEGKPKKKKKVKK